MPFTHVVSLLLTDAAGREFTVRQNWEAAERLSAEDESGIVFYFTDGNGGCDCNRADWIRDQVDPEYSLDECGNTLTLRALLIDGVVQEL